MKITSKADVISRNRRIIYVDNYFVEYDSINHRESRLLRYKTPTVIKLKEITVN